LFSSDRSRNGRHTVFDPTSTIQNPLLNGPYPIRSAHFRSPSFVPPKITKLKEDSALSPEEELVYT
jgi:hypothetical protein